MLDVIVADTEVFPKYFLLVAKTLVDGQTHILETREEITAFYNQHKDAIWCFYNSGYDQYIIKGIILGKNPKPISDFIVHRGLPGYQYSSEFDNVPMNCFDIQQQRVSLKVLEAFMGEDIRETTVPFDLDRELTPAEKDEVIFYCRHDVDMAERVLGYIKPTFTAKLGLCRSFNLPLSYMDKTAASLALAVLGAKKINPNNEFKLRLPETLELKKYVRIKAWFEKQCKDGEAGNNVYSYRLETDVAGCPCVFAWGGLHGALPCYHANGRIVGYDVSSLYPSLMIRYNYFSRALTDPQKYIQMYHDRIELKKAGDSKANALKLVLNSTFGGFKDKYAASYDPQAANNICVAGQLLLLDLIEHVEAHTNTKLTQVNTDGVFYEVPNQDEADKLDLIVREWEHRTGLNMERSEWRGIHQRDVNNYILIGEDGKAKGKGVLKQLSPIDFDLPIMNEALRAYFIDGTPLEQTIMSCNDYTKFQKVFKLQGKYTYALHNDTRIDGLKTFRVFASKDRRDTSLFKCYDEADGDFTMEVFAGSPLHCYIDNGKVSDKPIPDKLNREYYVEEAKRRLSLWFDHAPLLDGLM